MKSITIYRKELPEVLNCLLGIDQKGKVKFNEWLKINESIISLKKQAKDSEEILTKIKESTGFEKYLESVKHAKLKGVEDYIHSNEEIAAIEDFQVKHKDFLESEITIQVNMIPQSVIEELPKEALEFRIGVMKLVELKKDRDQPRTAKK